MRLDCKGADEFSFCSESLHALVSKLSRVHFIVLTDGDADAGAEFAVPFAARSPLQQEHWGRRVVFGRCSPCSREDRQASSAGSTKKLAARQKGRFAWSK